MIFIVASGILLVSYTPCYTLPIGASIDGLLVLVPADEA